MNKCTKCNKDIPEGIHFCPYCMQKNIDTETETKYKPVKNNKKMYLIVIGLCIVVAIICVLIFTNNKNKDKNKTPTQEEIKDNKDLEIEAEDYWRIEFELKRERTEKWTTCFEDLNFLKPDYKTIDDFNLRSKVFYLLNDESAWGELHRNTKTKYRKILKEISPVNLKNDMRLF